MNEELKIELTERELSDLLDFVDRALDRFWDRYTDNVIVENTSWEAGKRRMDPEIYDLAERLKDRLQGLSEKPL